jgi:hypothetical protein
LSEANWQKVVGDKDTKLADKDAEIARLCAEYGEPKK